MKKKRFLEGETAGGQAVLQRQEQPVWYHLAAYTALILVGLLMPRATVYGGLAPFGISLAACVEGPTALLACLATAVGYILCEDVVYPLRYIAALIAVAGFGWALAGVRKITQSHSYAPILAASAGMITGLTLNILNGFQWGSLIGELCESALAGGFAYFFKQTVNVIKDNKGPRSLSLAEQSSLVITMAVMLMAVHTITIGGISVGRILTMTVILLAAKAGQQQGGMLSGVVLGAATALSQPAFSYIAATYAFGGLIAGLFSRFGRLATAMLFVLVHALVAFGTGDSETVIFGIYEVAAASLIFMILPPSVERAANAIFSRAEQTSATEGMCRSIDMRLTYAANTMNEIAQTVDIVSKKLSTMDAPNMKEVYGTVCESICSGCRRRGICWKEEFTDTMAAFRGMGEVLKSNGTVGLQEVKDPLRSSCHHLPQVLSQVNSGYSRFVVKEHAYRRLADIRAIVTDQFEGMSSLLTELADDFRHMERADTQAARRIEQVCERYRIPIVQAVCLIGRRNRMTAELLIEGDCVPPKDSRWHKELCDACGCELDEPTVSKSGYMTKIRLSEKPRLTVRFAGAQRNCRTEKLCGDAYEHFYDVDGRFSVVLSDGMGTGGRAAVDGAMTAALAGRMLQAGFRFESILRIINSSLIIKSGDESLSTLDTVQLDLFTGHMQGLKAGAAPSFIYSRGHISKMTASSLPIGILQDVEAQPYEEYVDTGDWVIMISDGVAEGDTDWLEELICRLAQQDVHEKTMADEIVYRACERRGDEHGDDTTALVLRIC